MCTMAASAVIRLGHCVHNGGECSDQAGALCAQWRRVQ